MNIILPDEIKLIRDNNPHKCNTFCYHVHTKKSVRDGVSDIKDIVKKSHELGYKRAIPTDHGNIATMFDTFKECDKYDGMLAGCGCEFYLSLSNQLDERKTYHITTIVQNDIGYKNMLKLQYLSNIKDDEGELDGFKGSYYFKSRIHEKMLFHYQEGIIVTSGCRLSLFNQLFIEGKHDEAKSLLDMFSKNIDNFFIELHVANNPIEEELFYHLKKYADKNGIKTIPANDSHYINKEDLISWNLLGASRHNNDIYNDEYTIKNQDFHIKSYDEMWEDTFRCVAKKQVVEEKIINKEIKSDDEIKLFYNNTNIDDICLDYSMLAKETNECFNGFTELDNLITFNWSGNWKDRKLPMLSFEGAERAIRDRINEWLLERFGSFKKVPKSYIDRINLELQYAKETNNIDYFYFVMDFIQDCINEGIMPSGGRGSAASLLIGQPLGFHNVEVMDYPALIVERAMNPDRAKLMDIDLDFASSERQKAVELLERKYGKDHVVAIINYGVNGIKQSIQTVGRYLKISPAIMDNLSKEVSEVAKRRIRNHSEDEEVENKILLDDIKETSFYKEFFMNINTISGKNIKLTGDDFIDYVRRIAGTINNMSVHASGILVMNKPVYEYIPVTRVGGVLCSSYDMKVLEELNGLKIDILSVSVYDIIKDGLGFLYDNNMLR